MLNAASICSAQHERCFGWRSFRVASFRVAQRFSAAIAAGTSVALATEGRYSRPVLFSRIPATNAATPKYGTSNLTPEEFAVVEAFLNRRSSLAPDVRYRMAEQIATRIRPKLTAPPENFPSAENLIEAVAAERRASARYI